MKFQKEHPMSRSIGVYLLRSLASPHAAIWHFQFVNKNNIIALVLTHILFHTLYVVYQLGAAPFVRESKKIRALNRKSNVPYEAMNATIAQYTHATDTNATRYFHVCQTNLAVYSLRCCVHMLFLFFHMRKKIAVDIIELRLHCLNRAREWLLSFEYWNICPNVECFCIYDRFFVWCQLKIHRSM